MSNNKFIPLSVPNFSGNELKYVTNAINSEWVSTAGEYINQLENNLAAYLKVPQACALQSGTAGLHLALKLAGVTKNMEVIVPTLTFIAAVNSIRYCNAEPIFMDCDDCLCLDVEKVKQFIENECIFKENILLNKTTNKQIKAIVAVHIFGNMVDMSSLMDIAKKYNLKVIEDATEALGSYDNTLNKFAGTIADFGVYSFNGNKIITTGGGGALVAKNIEDIKRAKYLSTQAKDDTLYYIHDDIGYNYRMTNLQAALGLAQLEQLETFITIKIKNYNLYKEAGLELLPFNESIRTNRWFYSFLTNSRDELINKLNENNIQSRPIWKLNHTQKPYKDCQTYKIEKALYYYDRIINIPCSTNLMPEDIVRVTDTIKGFI